MDDRLKRMQPLFCAAAIQRLKQARIALFGLVGVGGYALEALARSGVGSLDLIDGDTVSLTDFNRQLLAVQTSIGKKKTDAARERVLSINPNATVNVYPFFYLPEREEEIDFSRFDYVLDAIDSVTGKILIAVRAQRAGVPVISCMGTGNKLDPTRFQVTDLTKTSVCPLARVMRRELKKRGIEHLKVVCSDEPPLVSAQSDKEECGRSVPASAAFVPSVAGLLMAGEAIKDLTGVLRQTNSP